MISWRKVASIPVIVGLLACEYQLHRQKLAEEDLRFFYSSLVDGNFSEARAKIDDAIHLSPGDARFAAWSAYLDGQTVPSETSSCESAAEPLTTVQRKAAERAVAGYQKASTLNQADAEFHHNLAWLFHRLGDDERAIAEHEKAIKLDQPNPILHASLGLFMEELGRIDQADSEYVKAISLSPQLIESRLFEDLRIRNPERARRVLMSSASSLEADLKQSDNPVVRAKLGQVYARLGDKERALPIIESALQELPNLSLAWTNIAKLQADAGDRDAALVSYKKSLALDSTVTGTYQGMADIFRAEGDKKQAILNYHHAAQSADAKLPPSVGHDSRLYRGSRQPIDSQLPPVLFRYLRPCDGPEAYKSLAELVPVSREAAYYRARAAECQVIQSPYRICPPNSSLTRVSQQQ